jgi:hypothetical protein
MATVADRWPLQKPPIGTPLNQPLVQAYGVQAYWPMLEMQGTTFRDYTKQQRTASINGNVFFIEGALSGFSGGSQSNTTQFVNCGSWADLNPTVEISLAIWINRHGNTADWIFARDDDTLGRSYAFGVQGAQLWLQINGNPVFQTGSFINDQWSLLSLSGNAANGYIGYCNGVQQATGTWTAPNTTTGPTNLGRRSYLNSQAGFTGSMGGAIIANKYWPASMHQELFYRPHLLLKWTPQREIAVFLMTQQAVQTYNSPFFLTAW